MSVTNNTPLYVKQEFPIFTRVSEDGPLHEIGTVTVEIPVTVQAGQAVIEPEGFCEAFLLAFGGEDSQ